MKKLKVVNKLRRCKNLNCNELYIPAKNDIGYCSDCRWDWEPNKEKQSIPNEYYSKEPE